MWRKLPFFFLSARATEIKCGTISATLLYIWFLFTSGCSLGKFGYLKRLSKPEQNLNDLHSHPKPFTQTSSGKHQCTKKRGDILSTPLIALLSKKDPIQAVNHPQRSPCPSTGPIRIRILHILKIRNFSPFFHLHPLISGCHHLPSDVRR